jgi:diphthamide synthase (EF-2-diphthine--ammonia ligase)
MSGSSIASWSGGKDSCLAYHKAVSAGRRVDYLLNFVSREHKRCCFHGIEPGLLMLQADLIGKRLVQRGELRYEELRGGI